MTQTENLLVLAIAVGMAYLVGKSMGQKAERAVSGACTCKGSNDTTDVPDSMGWFSNWSGLK